MDRVFPPARGSPPPDPGPNLTDLHLQCHPRLRAFDRDRAAERMAAVLLRKAWLELLRRLLQNQTPARLDAPSGLQSTIDNGIAGSNRQNRRVVAGECAVEGAPLRLYRI